MSEHQSHRYDHRSKHSAGIHIDAGDEHVMSPDDRSDNADRHHCVDHAQIAKDRLPTEGGDDVANDPEPGQDDDVDFGMAKKPEQMLG
jgi:hypothetical protein